MPAKTTKKVATKKVAKKAPAKKTVKKVVKPIAAPKPVMKEIPMPDVYCHCTKRKRNMILTCVSLGCLLIGILISQLFLCGCPHKRAPRVQFVNGCVDVASIKCPKMLENLPAMDTDNDGCITKVEYLSAKRAMRHHEKPVAEQPAVNVDDAIAPVME